MSRVSCVLLTSKNSSRLSVLQTALEVLNIPFEEMITVVGNHNESLAYDLRDLPLKVVLNLDLVADIHTLIRTGLSPLRKYYDGVFVCFADHPDLDVNVMIEMIKQFDLHEGKKIVHLKLHECGKDPILVPREFIPEILQHEDGDFDCSYLMQQYPARLAALEMPRLKPLPEIQAADDFSMIMVAQHG
ncbi:NTP transferase domain-containing protein [Bdellovibrio sp. SKB1291214]|uniref:NTP transferase domain-containing protein n=1 Tax=Bdellovibrio sp. SKB1291214 TaxID=1732569 RepID=UPI000B5199B4|nr:NTP transferase domain-containing protein [Bdellovibrio sp. SKB1291214]UYL07355.1 NTP transferase domain-containing protein [Bdellovibrio sp. SKB1291214]